MFHLAPETPDDFHEIEYLFDLAFVPGRTALSSYRLREGIAPLVNLSRVARDAEGGLAGAIRYWPIRIGPDRAEALLLGPVAVHPTHQGEGLGAQLIEDSLEAARQAGWVRVLLVGDAPYYRRFGFGRVTDIVFPPPTNPDRILGRPLEPGAFDGLAGEVHRWE